MTEAEIPEIPIYGKSLVQLHKVLKKEDRIQAKYEAEQQGNEANITPVIYIDFTTVTSIQEDYRRHGTVIMDAKTACIVVEPIEVVLNAWIRVKEALSGESGEPSFN